MAIATTTAEKGDIGVHVNALGLVTPEYTVNIRSRVDGQLVKVHYTEGQLVKKGELLAEIDDAPYRAALLQAEGQLGRDTAILENARRDLERYGEALARNAIPRQQYGHPGRHRSTVRRRAEGRPRSARQRSGQPRSPASPHPSADAWVYAWSIRATLVHASDTTALLVITQIEPITVVFSVAGGLPPGDPGGAQERASTLGDRVRSSAKARLAEGTLKTLDNQIDPATGTIKLKALFQNHDGALFPNQFVNAQLLVDTHRGVTLVENPVIQRNAQGTFVYVVTDEQKVKLHPVQVLTTDGKRSEIDGLEPGTVLAADNFNRLMDGAKIARDRRRRTPAKPAESPAE